MIMTKPSIASAAVLALALAACDDARPDDANRLGPTEWSARAVRSTDRFSPPAESMKLVIDLEDGDRVHWVDGHRYVLHKDFAVAELGFPAAASYEPQYATPERRYLNATVTHFLDRDRWVFEVLSWDTAGPELVQRGLRAVGARAFFGDRLAFHPVSDQQVERIARHLPGVVVVTNEELLGDRRYLPLNEGTAVGQVRITTADALERDPPGARDIVVLDRTPNDLPVVAGVVTAELQSMLSHVNVLSGQRGTPNMSLVDATNELARWDGRLVRLVVGATSYTVEDVTAADAEAAWRARRPSEVRLPAIDRERTALLDVDDVTLVDLPAVGGKAAHYGELRHIVGLDTPDGFVVPVAHYVAFLREHRFDRRIDKLLAEPRFRTDARYRRDALDQLRDDIRDASVDAALVAAIRDRLDAEFPGRRMRFRSSTNAEDLERCIGAGLYTSTAVDPAVPDRTIERGLRKVWASVWNLRAYEEREAAGIDHHAVAMAVLVHPAIVGEVANGVVITANLHVPDEESLYIDVQKGDEDAVVSPKPGVTSDQIVYSFYSRGQPIRYVGHSSLVPAGETVLTAADLRRVGLAAQQVRAHFTRHYPGVGRIQQPAMDVEFKVVDDGGQRRVIVKQARPYPLREVR
jgi:pyruvate, water dikinase